MVRWANNPERCRYAPNAVRLSLWRELHGPVPDGHMLGWTCSVAYCGNPGHMEVREKLNAGWRSYKKLRERLESLKIGQSFDLPDEPNDVAAVIKFRAGLGGTTLAKFAVRAWGDKRGLTVIRTGRWGVLEDDPKENINPRRIRIRCYRGTAIKYELRPAVLWLGQSYNPHRRSDFPLRPRCGWKACAFPYLPGISTCRHHSVFFAYPASLTGVSISKEEFYSPWEPNKPYTLVNDVRPPATWALEKSLRVIDRDGRVDLRHKTTDPKPQKTDEQIAADEDYEMEMSLREETAMLANFGEEFGFGGEGADSP